LTNAERQFTLDWVYDVVPLDLILARIAEGDPSVVRLFFRPWWSKVDGRTPTFSGGVHRMTNGTVKWFNNAKGYGFVQQDDGPDIFVHHTSIEMEGFRSLAEGDHVEFEVKEGPKGLQASKVVKV
jgi:CspA family cold shock protein